MNWPGLPRLLLIPAILALCLPLITLAEARPAAKGILSGTVSRWPLTPHEPSSGPTRRAQVPGARIEVETANGTPLTSVATDPSGNFRVELPPGTYRLMMPGLRGVRPRNLPPTVTIGAGQEERLDISLDSGLR